MYAIENNF